jgi:hypothetical protein
VAEQSGKKRRCKKRNRILGTRRLLQQWEERLEGFRVLDKRLCEFRDVCILLAMWA